LKLPACPPNFLVGLSSDLGWGSSTCGHFSSSTRSKVHVLSLPFMTTCSKASGVISPSSQANSSPSCIPPFFPRILLFFVISSRMFPQIAVVFSRGPPYPPLEAFCIGNERFPPSQLQPACALNAFVPSSLFLNPTPFTNFLVSFLSPPPPFLYESLFRALDLREAFYASLLFRALRRFSFLFLSVRCANRLPEDDQASCREKSTFSDYAL